MDSNNFDNLLDQNNAISDANDANASNSNAISGQMPVIHNISPRTISGVLSNSNLNAIDWSLNGLIAFGSHHRVIIVDTKSSLKVCQSLHKHNASVCVIKWSYNSALKLASADTNGVIIIWNVFEPNVLSLINPTKDNKSIISIEWIDLTNTTKNCTQNYLLVTYSSNNLVLYDSELGEIIWNKNYNKSIKSISLDPFCASNALFGINSNECNFGIINNLNVTKCPNGEFEEYKVTIKGTAIAPNSPKNVSALSKYELRVKGVEDSDEHNYFDVLNEYIHASYHRSVRNQIFLVFNREILLIDLTMKAIICSIPIERNCSNLIRVYSCQQRNAFFCCHEFGTISLRLYQKQLIDDTNYKSSVLLISYANLCQSEGLRLSKQNKIFGYCVSPFDETKVALMLNNGRLIVKTIRKTNFIYNQLTVPFLSDLILMNEYNSNEFKKGKYRILMTNLLSTLSYGPIVIRMCPPVTLRNWPIHKPLLAVGDSSGVIQIWNLSTAFLDREFSIHSFPVRGIEWTSLTTFISYAYPTILSNAGKVNNELNITELNSGKTYPLRLDKNSDFSPIETLKISHLKQYLIISFKDEPFEIWDLNTLTLLRIMPKQFSTVTAIEWSPLYNKRVENLNEKSNGNTNLNAQSLPSKENFVVTNTSGELYHFSIEGNIVKEITCIPPDTEMNGNITCIAWKSDQVILGDTIGNMNVWDLKKKVSRAEPTNRGMIKKIKFGPGRGNMKLLMLFNDGVDIWDIKEFKLNSQLKYPRDISFKIEDIDWAGSDRPILATSESAILIADLRLKHFTSSMIDLILNDVDAEGFDYFLINYHFMSSMSQLIYKSKLILNQLDNGPDLPICDIERNLLVAKLFYDIDSYHFWNIALNVINDKKGLDLNYDLFMENQVYKEIQSERVALIESLRNNYSQNKTCCEWQLFLNEPHRAVQILLETDPQTKDYYIDALKACLIASLQSKNEQLVTTAHPVIKLVATNLIASGKVDEGSQLLCLIGKTQDACRYLQSANKWYEAVWLAKCSLDFEEYNEIMRRFCDHLISHNKTKSAIMMLLSVRQFSKVIHILSNCDVERAVLFATVCVKRELINIDDNKDILNEIYEKYSKILDEAGLDNAIKYFKHILTK